MKAQSESTVPLHYVRPTLLRRIALRFAKGEPKYGRGNWKRAFGDKLDVQFLRERYDHAMDHMMALRDGNDTDDNVAAVGWFLNLADEVEQMGVSWKDILAIVTPEDEHRMNEKIQMAYKSGLKTVQKSGS